MSECQKRSNVVTGLCQPGEAAVFIWGSHPQGRGAACRRSAIGVQNAGHAFAQWPGGFCTGRAAEAWASAGARRAPGAAGGGCRTGSNRDHAQDVLEENRGPQRSSSALCCQPALNGAADLFGDDVVVFIEVVAAGAGDDFAALHDGVEAE